jgi:DNA (cytosine-5)-methyltransferase 1
VVRFFRHDEEIPCLYNRNGIGNLFYITHKLEVSEDGSNRCVPFDDGEFQTTMRQGFDPRHQNFRKLRGMDLFCGSGNFGRGLGEGGAVEMAWVNDI